MCSRIIQTETVFSKTEMSIEGNINFLQNSSLSISPTYSSEFSIGQSIFSFVVM